jgi:addiction module HigA family antidote
MPRRPRPNLFTPPHPGAFIRTEIFAPLDLTVTAAAAVLGVSRQSLSNVLTGAAALSGDLAVRLDKAFGVDLETLLQMQASYDIAAVRRRAGAIHVRRYRPATRRRHQAYQATRALLGTESGPVVDVPRRR